MRKYRIGGDKPYRERVGVVVVKQENGELWIRLTACNAPLGVLPRFCIMPDSSLVLEETENLLSPP